LNTLEEVFDEPQIQHRQIIIELNYPELGKGKQLGIMPKLSETPGSIRTLPPRRGEHSEEILRGLGYRQEEIENLRQGGALG